MNYRNFNLKDWINHISSAIKDERELDGNEMRDLVVFLSKMPRWIPVNEKLPNLDDYGSIVWQREVLITGYESFDDTKEPFVSEACVEDVIDKHMYNTIITAWMPLPKPYKAEIEEK